MTSLSQVEAAERAGLLAVERYDVELDLTGLPDGPEVRVVSTVRFSCRTPGASSFVECAARVVRATLDGRDLPAAVDGRIALADLPASGVLVVESVQADTAEGEGVHRAVDPSDGEVYLWTSFEPDEAHHVYACFDQPDLKAPHAFTVTAPAHWTVLSNSGDAVVTDVDGGRRWVFPDTPPLSTYNVVVDAGPFHEVRREAGGHDLGLYARRSLAAVLERDADELFLLTEQGLGFFGRTFAMPFPQRRYDQVFVPEMGGAMENYGCVTWSDDFLRRTTPSPAERELLARVLLHEMAHMWFGNIVTMRWWDDLWLNEAFAEFAAHWAAERATSYTDVWASHLAGEELRAYLADAGPTSHPIRQPIPTVAEAASIFDAITYPKGASVLHQLMTYVGEERFAEGMASYFRKHAWTNTTLQDLVDVQAAVSGRDLDAWQATWLERAGTDRLGLVQDDAGLVLTARGAGGPPRPHVLAVGAYARGPEGLVRTGRALVEVQGERTPVDLPPGADLYLVNDDDLTFAGSRTDDPAGLLASAALLPTPLARGVAVATVWDMLVSGEARAADVVACLTRVLLAETASSVVEPYLSLALDAAELWSPASDRPALLAQVADACRRLAEVPERRQAALRTLARTAPLADLRALPGDDVDLQWRVLVRAAELGEDTAAEVAALLQRDPDPDAEVRATVVRAAAPTAQAKEQAWQAVVGRTVPVSNVGAVTTAFWRPGQEALLAPYADRYLELLPDLDRGGMIPAMVFTNRLFPVHGAPPGFADRVEAAVAAAPPVVAKNAREKADLLRRVERSRGLLAAE
ncbi:MAG: pepN1 [Frankiales bacterium]|nr:pepN1 [Frankiales bacterium]